MPLVLDPVFVLSRFVSLIAFSLRFLGGLSVKHTVISQITRRVKEFSYTSKTNIEFRISSSNELTDSESTIRYRYQFT